MRSHPAPLLVLAALLTAGCDEGRTRSGGGLLEVQGEPVEFGEVCARPTAPDLQPEIVTRGVHVANRGNALLYLNEVKVDPADVGFSVDAAKVPGALAAGEEVEIPVAFSPVAPGGAMASLVVRGEDASVPASRVPLHGQGRSTPPEPAVTLSCPGGRWGGDHCAAGDPTVFFADTPLGSFAEMGVTVGNDGCLPLEITQVTAATDTTNGEDPATFALADGQAPQVTVAGGATADLRVRFAPGAEGQLFAGSLTFKTNDPAKRQVAIVLNGLGIAPSLELRPADCDFTLLPGVGAGPCSGKFTVVNLGQDALEVTAARIQARNAMFRVVQPAQSEVLTIGGGATLVDAIVVEYLPAIQRGRDVLLVESNGGGASADLTGGSPPVAAAEPASVDFGTSLARGQDYYQKVEIRNVATYDRQLALSILNVAIDTRGTSNVSGTFDVPANPPAAECPTPIAPGTEVAVGESATACVHFKSAPEGGSFGANLIVLTNDPERPAPDGLIVVLQARAP